MEGTRLSDIDGVKSGTESSSLGLIVIFTLDVVLLLVGFALLGNSWNQLQARASSGKKEDRGPGGMLLNLG